METEYLILVVLVSFLFTPWFCLHRCARKEGLAGSAASAARWGSSECEIYAGLMRER